MPNAFSRGLAAAVAIAAVGACQGPGAVSTGNTITGESQTLFGAQATSWAKLDANQQVSEVGTTLPLAAIEAAPTAEQPPTIVTLQFPEVVRNQTFINHLSLDYSPHGHPPENIYTVPHFDFHYYAMTPEEVAAIDCSKEAGVAPEQIPAGYALLPPPKGECVPKMGFHASKLSSPELARENPQKFTHTFILGYYDGRLTFVEPMATRDFLLTKQTFSHEVPKPASLGKATRYPTSFTATYDEQAKAYNLVLSNFVQAQ